MEISDQNPFESGEQYQWNQDEQPKKKRNFVPLLNGLFVLLLLALVGYALKDSEFSFRFSVEDLKKKMEEAAIKKKPAFTPFHALALAHEKDAYVWVFSFSSRDSLYLSVIDPISKKVLAHQPFPYNAGCMPPYPDLYQCLRDPVLTVMNEKLWWSLKPKNQLMAFDLRNGKILEDSGKLNGRFGKIASGFFETGIQYDGRCSFINSDGEKVEFFPFSEKMRLDRNSKAEEKFTGSILKFFVEEGGKKRSDVYVSDAKLEKTEGTIRFAWDFNDCKRHVKGDLPKEINRVWKLPQSYIGPAIVAENGNEALILHRESPAEDAAYLLEAIDAKGNLLWKASPELAKNVARCKKNPLEITPHYDGPLAVFYDESFYDYSLESIGLEYKTGKVLWHMNVKDIAKILNPGS